MCMDRNVVLATSADRAAYKRMKRQSMRDARITDRLEEEQQGKQLKFGRAVLTFHSQIEKE